MNIDTRTVRRLRDALIENGRLAGGQQAAVDGRAGGPGKEASIKRVTPFVETMYLMMTADGLHDDDENAAIRGAMRTLTHGLLDEADLEQLLQACAELVSTQGIEARLQAIGNRICADRADRETGFTLAAAVALADENVAAEESTLLASIAEWFGLSSRRSQEILQQFDASR